MAASEAAPSEIWEHRNGHGGRRRASPRRSSSCTESETAPSPPSSSPWSSPFPSPRSWTRASNGDERINDFRAGALAALGNAKRLASDFSGAGEAFREARSALQEGTGDPLEEARLISLEASLLNDLGEFRTGGGLPGKGNRDLPWPRRHPPLGEDPHQTGRLCRLPAAGGGGPARPGQARAHRFQSRSPAWSSPAVRRSPGS